MGTKNTLEVLPKAKLVANREEVSLTPNGAAQPCDSDGEAGWKLSRRGKDLKGETILDVVQFLPVIEEATGVRFSPPSRPSSEICCAAMP